MHRSESENTTLFKFELPGWAIVEEDINIKMSADTEDRNQITKMGVKHASL